MADPSPSPGLEQLPEDLQLQFDVMHADATRDLEGIEGLQTVHNMLVERFCFMYVALRHMERDWTNLDAQRYNQFTSLWIKVGSDLLNRFQEIYEKGALNDLFAEKVLTIVVEELNNLPNGPDVIDRIKGRLESARKEAAATGS